ncbi:MAG TPA: hypothetical protein VN493_12060 [Thermoanaerobaculia bacterium]|nr:hypothetical protein [Thermoanaerobaculia bacterium]
MNRICSAIVISALLILPAASRAEVGIAGTVGSLGVGLELTVGGTGPLQGRLGLHGYEYSDRREASDIEYDGEANLRTATALLDWHPGSRGFRLTGGLVYNDTEITGSSLPPASGVYDIGGVPVPVAILGTLDGKVEFEPIVPYAGLGWGRAPGSSGFGVTLDLGVIFQGEGEVTLTPVIPAGSPLNNPLAREALQILLDREERELQDDIADYDLYPVVSLGISYRF